MEALQPHLDFLAEHLLAIVFVSAAIEASGVPFPSRMILIVAATLSWEARQLVGLMGAAIAGSLLGDHVPYVAGRLAGPRLLQFYCRVTLGSERCVEKTIDYFRRFGSAAVLMGRFVTSVRLFSAALSGCGHISYARFLAFDAIGTVVYAVLWVTVGHLLGEQLGHVLERHRAARLLVLVIPAMFLALLGYRLWRRFHYGAARPPALESGATCIDVPAAETARRS